MTNASSRQLSPVWYFPLTFPEQGVASYNQASNKAGLLCIAIYLKKLMRLLAVLCLNPGSAGVLAPKLVGTCRESYANPHKGWM